MESGCWSASVFSVRVNDLTISRSHVFSCRTVVFMMKTANIVPFLPFLFSVLLCSKHLRRERKGFGSRWHTTYLGRPRRYESSTPTSSRRRPSSSSACPSTTAWWAKGWEEPWTPVEMCGNQKEGFLFPPESWMRISFLPICILFRNIWWKGKCSLIVSVMFSHVLMKEQLYSSSGP